MFHPIVENDSVFIVSGIQGLLSPFKVLLLWPRIFDCLQRLCQQSLGIGCTTCIWSLCLNQSCVTKRCLNVSLAYRGCCNHCARRHPYCYAVASLLLFHFYLSESLLLSVLFFLPYFSFYFHYHLPPPSLSRCAVGGRCMPVPRWRGGEINSEGVWSFLKDFPGKTLLSGW